eukprot:TRINITY_DN2562_c0_g1_i1.p1 TRINITY_DN2562_c0_g1~~TRINITY_DN2562_c0_g1_i1.p1  ORF type:complete len:691 (+),score=159.36 TRINITY_DN2562_c0_g1_i1:99-2171(+)
MSYRLKRIEFHGKRLAVVLQDENGPCPLIAIANILLLQGKLKLHDDYAGISQESLITLIADFMLNECKAPSNKMLLEDWQRNVGDAIQDLPKLQKGLDVNIRFKKINDMEFTRELVIFDILGIDLVHGWLVDPNDEAFGLISPLSYNQLVEKLIDASTVRPQPSVASESIGLMPPALSSSAADFTFPTGPADSSEPVVAASSGSRAPPSSSAPDAAPATPRRRGDEQEAAELAAAIALSGAVSLHDEPIGVVAELDSMQSADVSVLSAADAAPLNAAAVLVLASERESVASVSSDEASVSAGVPSVADAASSEHLSTGSPPPRLADADAPQPTPTHSDAVSAVSSVAAASFESILFADDPLPPAPPVPPLSESAETCPAATTVPAVDASAPGADAVPQAVLVDGWLDISEPLLPASSTPAAPAGPPAEPASPPRRLLNHELAASDPARSELVTSSSSPTRSRQASSLQASSSSQDALNLSWGSLPEVVRRNNSKLMTLMQSSPKPEKRPAIDQAEQDRILREGAAIESFLERTASQLTYHGLYELHGNLKKGQLCVFFRNNHFSTLLKQADELYVLLTDSGYGSLDAVWEKLDQVDNDTVFVDDFFRPYKQQPEPGITSMVSDAVTSVSNTIASLVSPPKADPQAALMTDEYQPSQAEIDEQLRIGRDRAGAAQGGRGAGLQAGHGAAQC